MRVMYETRGQAESQSPVDTDIPAVTAAVFRDAIKILPVDMTPRRMVGGY